MRGGTRTAAGTGGPLWCGGSLSHVNGFLAGLEGFVNLGLGLSGSEGAGGCGAHVGHAAVERLEMLSEGVDLPLEDGAAGALALGAA